MAALAELAEAANIQESHYTIEPENAQGSVARRFVAQFIGDDRTATRRCNAFYEAQRTSTGWKRLQADSPGGGKSNLYIDRDKNGRQLATEKLGRKLRDAIKRVQPSLEVYLQRSTATIVCSYKPLAKIIVGETEAEWHIEYQEGHLQALSLDKGDIKKAMEESLAPAAAEPWCL